MTRHRVFDIDSYWRLRTTNSSMCDEWDRWINAHRSCHVDKTIAVHVYPDWSEIEQLTPKVTTSGKESYVVWCDVHGTPSSWCPAVPPAASGGNGTPAHRFSLFTMRVIRELPSTRLLDSIADPPA